MRISDWSSDVCSSDLVVHEFVRAGAPAEIMYVSKPHIGTFRLTGVVSTMREEIIALGGEVRFESKVTDLVINDGQLRSEERRVGKECVSPCRSRWSPDHSKKKKQKTRNV